MAKNFQKFGDWDLVLNLASNMSADIQRANKITLMQLSSRAEAMAVKHLRDQDLKWRKLNPDYAKRKASQGLSDKILIATSSMFQSVTSQVNQQGTQSFAGVLKKARNKKGVVIADIALTMEYGSVKQGIPARPLWRPVYKKMKEYLVKEQLFAANAIREMKKRTGGKG